MEISSNSSSCRNRSPIAASTSGNSGKMATSRGMMSVMSQPTQEHQACMTFIVECIDTLDQLSMLNLLNEDFLDLLLGIALALDYLSTDTNDRMLRWSLMEAVTNGTTKTSQHLSDTLDKEVSQYPGWIDFSLALIRSLVDTFDLEEILEHTTARGLNGSSSSLSSSSSSSSRHVYMHQLFKRLVESEDNVPLEPPGQQHNPSSTQENPFFFSEDVNTRITNTHCLSDADRTRTQHHPTKDIITTTTTSASTNHNEQAKIPSHTTSNVAHRHSRGTKATLNVHNENPSNQYASIASTKLSNGMRTIKSTTPCVSSSKTRLILEDISSFLDSSSSSSSSSSSAAATAMNTDRDITKLPSSSTINSTLLHHSKPQTHDTTSKPTFYFSGSSRYPIGPSHGFNCKSRGNGEGETYGENERRLFKRKRFMQ